MSHLASALSESWSPFILVAGLLLVGEAADRDGLFRWAGERVSRAPGGDLGSTVATMLVVAVVTATLNLDTSVVFMTPIALNVARTRRMSETPLLYGVIFMSNAASTLLLGSNLTNQLIVAARPLNGTLFALHMLVPWLVSVALTIGAVIVLGRTRPVVNDAAELLAATWRPGIGSWAVVASALAMLATSSPALLVISVGIVVQVVGAVAARRVSWRRLYEVLGPWTLGALFVVAVLVGWLGRSWHETQTALAHTNSPSTAVIGMLGALAINNLPATALFAGGVIAHPLSLLIGLDLGPNAFVTGSLSTILWWRVAREQGATPSLARFVAVGLPLSLVTIAAALATH